MQLTPELERELKSGVDPGLKRNGAVSWAAALLMVAVLLGVMQWRAGAWQAGYGAYPDEPSHFMGGLMVRDFLGSGSRSPIAFAENYYLFQPYFAIGYWPPFFYILEGIWMLVAGYSRPAMMLFSGLLTALAALLLFAAARRRAGTVLSLAIAALFLAIPSVEWSSSVVMTDVCVALFCLATTLAAGKYLETPEWRWALLTGLAASLALLTKYLSAFVLLPPLLVILVDRRWDVLRNARTWAIVGITAILCGPWALWSRRFLFIGFDGRQGDLWSRVMETFKALHVDFGYALEALVAAAMIWGIFRWNSLGITERLCWLGFPCLALFLLLGPSGIERRYLLVAYPELLLVVALAIQWIGERQKSLYWCLVALIACLAVAGVARNRVELPGSVSRKVARDLVREKDPVAILVPGSREGPVIAELASAEAVRSRIMLIRPSKLLARMNWLGTQYELLVPDVKSMESLFDKYPIGVIVTAANRGGPESPHDRLLREMLASDPRWILERQYVEPGVDWNVYRRPRNPKMDVDTLAAFMRTHLSSLQ